jgi:hypothetical protein
MLMRDELTLISLGVTVQLTSRSGSRWEKNVSAAFTTRINRLVADRGYGNQVAREALIPVVCEELRQLPRRHPWRERPDHILQSVALVNERYPRLVRRKARQRQSRAHFFGVAAPLNATQSGGSCPQPPGCEAWGWNTARAGLRRDMKKDAGT